MEYVKNSSKGKIQLVIADKGHKLPDPNTMSHLSVKKLYAKYYWMLTAEQIPVACDRLFRSVISE